MSPKIGSVRERLVVNFNDEVVQLQKLRKLLSRDGIGEFPRKIDNDGLVFSREKFVEIDLRRAADHALTFFSAKLSRF